jgi:mRNA-degrading endonuclease RelE of RelBE toxin-antitoxin system
MLRRIILLLFAIVSLIAISAAVRAYVKHFETELMEHKRARTTTGVVLDKKLVQFASDQTTYQNEEGRTVYLDDWRRRSGEYRIFYKIDNFDQIPEAHRSALVAAEERRNKQFGPRFRIADEQTFEQAEAGQATNVVYRWADDSTIEVISFELRRPQR